MLNWCFSTHNLLRTAGERPVGEVSRMTFVYLMTGERRYGERAVQMLTNIAGWNPEGATSFCTHDQVLALALYNLTPRCRLNSIPSAMLNRCGCTYRCDCS